MEVGSWKSEDGRGRVEIRGNFTTKAQRALSKEKKLE